MKIKFVKNILNFLKIFTQLYGKSIMKTNSDKKIEDFTGGLSPEDLRSFISVLGKEDKIESALIFGNRAKSNYENGSDMDIVLKGINLDHDTINCVSYFLNEESDTPYRFDILNFNKITNKDLVSHINRKDA